MNNGIPIKILFLAADPSDASRLRLLQELRDIKERLRIAKEPGKFELESRESIKVADITQAILDVEPQIIHFSGHGTNQGELYFENESGQIQPVTADALAAMFDFLVKKVQIDCVLLNACYSEIQAKAIAKHIPYVIGMNDSIGDKAAIAFAVGFYTALAANSSFEEAYESGCVQIQLEGIPEHLKPVLYDNVKEDFLTPSSKPVDKNIPNPFVPLTGKVENSEQFFNREKELQRVFEILNSGSSVALIGEREIGKSSLLWAIYQQAEIKLIPPRKPIYLDLSQVYDEDDFYNALCSKVGIEKLKGFSLTRVLEQQRPRLLLLLDEIEKMAWQGFTNNLRGQLRGLANGHDAPLRLVVAASTSLDKVFPDSNQIGMVSPFQNICIEERIQLWDEATVRDFIRDRLENNSIQFTEAEIREIITRCGGYPKEIMGMCYQIYAQHIENQK